MIIAIMLKLGVCAGMFFMFPTRVQYVGFAILFVLENVSVLVFTSLLIGQTRILVVHVA